MIRKYHNHKPQTTPWHSEEEPLNHHETPGDQGGVKHEYWERSGSVVGPRGRGLELHRRHCVVVLEQDTFILA